MTRAEADRWASASAYRKPLFHATSTDAASSIRRRGFMFGRQRFGRVWGHAIYATPDPTLAEIYRIRIAGPSVLLELYACVANVLRFEIVPARAALARDELIARLPGGFDRYVAIGVELATQGVPRGDIAAAAFTRLVAESWYDAIEIVEPRFSSAVGGTQLVIFGGREKVTVIDE